MSKDFDLPKEKDDLTPSYDFTPKNTFNEHSESNFSQFHFPYTFNFENKNSFIDGSESESNLLHFSNQTVEDIFTSDNLANHFLQKKRSKDKHGIDIISDIISDDSNEIKNLINILNNEENNNQEISTKNIEEILMSKKGNEFQMSYEENLFLKENTFQVRFVMNNINQNRLNDIKNSKNIGSERGKDKDNFTIILFKQVNDRFLKRLNANSNQKIHPPNHYIFTHDTNLVDIYVFLDIQHKNFLFMTQEDKKTLDQLLIDLKIKKKFKKKETYLTEKSKEYKDVINLLLKNHYINQKEIQNIETVNNVFIKYLKDNGCKDKNEDDILYKEDRDKFHQLLIDLKIKKTFDHQKKNKDNFKNIDNKDKNMTLRELLQEFFYSQEYEDFKKIKKVEEIDKKFKIQKKYSLLDMDEKGKIGFIRMFEEDCGLNDEKKNKVKQLTDYFSNKELNAEELQNYRKIAIPK